MRCFVAIEIPEEIRASLGALRGRFRKQGPHASWVRTENMHLTLRFLGNLDEAQRARYRDELAARLAGFGPLRIAVRGTGVFPNARRPSVLWAGARVEDGDLEGVQRQTEAAAQAIGLARETKSFHAHITLARIRNPRKPGNLAETLAASRDYFGGEFTATAVTLFSSELRPGGTRYRPVRTFRLAPGEGPPDNFRL